MRNNEKVVAVLSEIKKVFIIGPIEKYEDFNFGEFMKVHKFLESKGFEVVNPHLLDRSETSSSLRDSFRQDILEMLDCDFAVVIPDWSESHSAISKMIVCQQWEMPVHTIIIEDNEIILKEDIEYHLDITIMPKIYVEPAWLKSKFES